MKTTIITTLVVVSALTALGDASSIAKQRAKEAASQNNVRQGVGAPPSASQRPAAQQPPGQPQKSDPLARLKADIAGIVANPSASDETKKQLATDMLACARGSNKPGEAAVQKFAASLSAALAGKSIEPSVQARLVQNINLVLNSAGLSEQRTSEVGDDVQAILQTAGVARAMAVNITRDLKAIAEELQATK